MSQGADEHFAQLSCNGKDPAVFEDLSYYQGFKDLRTFFLKPFLVLEVVKAIRIHPLALMNP